MQTFKIKHLNPFGVNWISRQGDIMQKDSRLNHPHEGWSFWWLWLGRPLPSVANYAHLIFDILINSIERFQNYFRFKEIKYLSCLTVSFIFSSFLRPLSGFNASGSFEVIFDPLIRLSYQMLPSSDYCKVITDHLVHLFLVQSELNNDYENDSY